MKKILSTLLIFAALVSSSFAAINPNQIQSFESPLIQLQATVSGNALTVTLPATNLQFKNPTINGAPIWVYSGALSVVTPTSGATLGSVSAQSTRYAAIVQYNSGTPNLCIINMGGGITLDESATLASTSISGASTSASTCYATTGVAASTYRIVGYFDATEATAGVWATAPSVVQGMGGQTSLAFSQSSVLSAAIATTSGSSIAVTGLSSQIREITISLVDVSTNGTANYTIQLGTAAGLVSTGYKDTYGYFSQFGTSSSVDATTAINLVNTSATQTLNGIIKLVLADEATNTWNFSTDLTNWLGYHIFSVGSVTLPGRLDRFTLATTDTFDLGKISFLTRN